VFLAEQLFLGNDLLAWLLLALGGALVVGNGLALVRPPERSHGDDLDRAPVRRSVIMIAIGAVATIWALATLVAA
jgi:hypothetical protein